MSIMQPNPDLDVVANEHRDWITQFHQLYLRNWERMYRADYEAAMTEAFIRRILQRHGLKVEPNEDLTGRTRRPDFRCTSPKGRFYVEVTCISIPAAEKKTGIEDGARGFRPFNAFGMTEAVFAECRNKASQCANLDAPALVAIGTFHGIGAKKGFKKFLVGSVLTGKTRMAWEVDIQSGEQAGEAYQTTDLQAAAFLKPDETEKIGFARNPISGVLLCGVSFDPPKIIGVLHPKATRPFDPAVLPNVEFGTVEIDHTSQELNVCWPTND